MWIAWTVCWLNNHCDLAAVRNRLRSQTPPTRFHAVIHWVLTQCKTAPLLEQVLPYCMLLLCYSSTYWACLYLPLTLNELTILTFAVPNQADCFLRGETRLCLVSLKQTRLSPFGLIWILTDGEDNVSVAGLCLRPLDFLFIWYNVSILLALECLWIWPQTYPDFLGHASP